MKNNLIVTSYMEPLRYSHIFQTHKILILLFYYCYCYNYTLQFATIFSSHRVLSFLPVSTCFIQYFEHMLTLKFFWQALLIFIGLCCARDEVYWLLRHNDNPPQQKSKGKTAEDLVDRQLPELLFHMEELRGKMLVGLFINAGKELLYSNISHYCASVAFKFTVD